MKMRLWTIQGIEIYEQLQRDGMAYCTKPAWSDDEKFMKAYHWMADQMRQRIGEPPIKDIKYPMWAWYQYNSAKSNKPPRSYLDIQEGISAYMEIDFPDSTGSSAISSYRTIVRACLDLQNGLQV
jgi:hypothetical protein